MIEIVGNLWDHYPKHIICLTTNGTIKNDGSGVMGRGCALEATKRFPGIARNLGAKVKAWGNCVQWLDECGPNKPSRILAFPVKHNWWETADIELIRSSANELAEFAEEEEFMHETFILPRPGCGNGKLSWGEVKPIIAFLPNNIHVISWR